MIIDSNMIISGFVSKIVNDFGDILKKKIKEADDNRKSNSRNPETRVYQVTVDALNEFTKNKYEGQDILYDSAESILKGFKIWNDDYIEAVRTGLNMLDLQVTSEVCEDFLGVLRQEICKDEEDILYKGIIMHQHEKIIEDMHEGFKESHQNEEKSFKALCDIKEDTRYMRSVLERKDGRDIEYNREYYIENRAKEYAQKWDKNVFLNDYNERDENAHVNIKLRALYLDEQLPHYIWKTNKEPRNDLKDLLNEYIIDNKERKMLLILGQPGIGKSTLITWIMANLIEKRNDIFVYQFASDLKRIVWNGEEVLNSIFDVLNLKDRDLNNKTLNLDGFDEIDTSGDRKRILNGLNKDLIRMNRLEKFSLIITCRENYLDGLRDIGCDYITLQSWNDEQIKNFCKIYEEKNAGKNVEIKNNSIQEVKINKILENKEVFGIPLILYMVLALNIAIEKNSSVVDVYDQIFSPDGGKIYDRCYDVEHRINEPKIKEQINKISQRIAFWMFENNAEKAFIHQKNFKEICDIVMSETKDKIENIQSDVLIGNYFKLRHCEGEGTDELQFIHRSIYEYFVVVYFFESIHNLQSKEDVAGMLGELLKDGRLTKQILEFIKCKFDSMKGLNLANITKEVFDIMLRDGMTFYYIKKRKKPILCVIEREGNIFINMLEVVGLWNSSLGELDDRIIVYIQNNKENELSLSGIKLGVKADLREVYLCGANLCGADLSGVNLSRVNLSGAYLSGAYLSGAYLRGAHLSGAYLRKANLRRADLWGADLKRANLSGANFRIAKLGRADLVKASLIGADLLGATLIEADLNGADLNEANLRIANLARADLKGANLKGVDLIGANFEKANLKETIFDDRQVVEICEKNDLNDSMVFIYETEETISYKEYCMRKLKCKE